MLDIPKDNIIISETQAPVYIVYVESDEIQRLAENPNVLGIYYYDNSEAQVEAGDLEAVLAASTVPKIYDEIGVTGDTVNVGIIDGGKVEPDEDGLPSSRITYVTSSSSSAYTAHATFVARIAAGSSGVAREANIFSSSDNLISAILNMSDLGVTVINYSMGAPRTSAYTGTEIYLDYLINTKKIAFVKSAGNNRGYVTSPGLAYNAITVGGFFNQGTSDVSDDCMYMFSNYGDIINGVQGCIKPDVIADQSKDISMETGTSYAAPYVTGTIALLQDLCPSLKTQPEVVKAILMASCHRKVNPTSGDATELMTEGLTDHQGAGVVDPYMAIAIAGSGNYGVRYMTAATTQTQIRIKQPSYNSSGLNVSLAWLVEPTDSETASESVNLDLEVYNGINRVGASNNSNSSSEMVYVIPSVNEDEYRIQVKRQSNIGNSIRFAYAFSVDNNRYQYSNENEGIFFIRNRYNNAYLTYSIDNDNVIQESYNGEESQQWLIKDGIISPLSSPENSLAIGDVIGGSYKKAILNNSNQLSFSIIPNEYDYQFDGSYTILNVLTNDVLVPFNNATSSGTLVSWYPKSSSNNSQKWYLDPISYQRGDVNLDGRVNTNDAAIFLQYLSEVISFSSVQEYLADMNGDGIIDVRDHNILMNLTEI